MPTWGATEPWRPERKRGPEEPRRRCLSPNIRPVRPSCSPGGGPPPRPAGSPQRWSPGPPLLSPRRQLWVIPWSWGAPLFSGRTLCTSCAPTSSHPVSLLPFGVQCLKGLIDAPLVTPFIHLFLNNFFCVLPGNPPHDSPRPDPPRSALHKVALTSTQLSPWAQLVLLPPDTHRRPLDSLLPPGFGALPFWLSAPHCPPPLCPDVTVRLLRAPSRAQRSPHLPSLSRGSATLPWHWGSSPAQDSRGPVSPALGTLDASWAPPK